MENCTDEVFSINLSGIYGLYLILALAVLGLAYAVLWLILWYKGK